MRRWGMCSLLVETLYSSPDFLHENFGQNVAIIIRQKITSRPGLQMGDVGGDLLRFVDLDAQPARDLRETPFAERFHVIGNDFVFHRILAPGPLQLEQQAFAQIPRADSGRMKGLNDLEALPRFCPAECS